MEKLTMTTIYTKHSISLSLAKTGKFYTNYSTDIIYTTWLRINPET